MATKLAVFYRSLSQLHGAGVGWPQAVATALGRRDEAADARDAFGRAIVAVREGKPLSDALADAIPAVDRAGIRAAEVSGRMEELLADLARRHEDLDRRRLAESRALAYPIFVAHLAAFLFGVPDLAAGRTMAALRWALLILVPTHVFLWARRRLRRADADGRPVPPVLALLRTKSAVEEADAKSLAALGWLHEAGVPPLEAIPLAALAGAGGRASADLCDATREVEAGRPREGAWSRVPAEIRSALATGERTGTLGAACARTAAALEESASHRRTVFMERLKPILIVVLGLFVGLRVVLFYADAYRTAMGRF